MGQVEIKIGFFSPHSIHAQQFMGEKSSDENKRVYQHSLITKQVMTAICKEFVATRFEDLDHILGMLFTQSDVPDKPLNVTKSTFVSFIKNDMKVAVSDKDLDLFMNMNNMFTTSSLVSKSELLNLFEEYFRVERYQWLQESHFEGTSMYATPNQSFIPPEQVNRNISVNNVDKSGNTSNTGYAAAPFRGYQDSQENSRDQYGTPIDRNQ